MTKEDIDYLKKTIKKGTRIELINMDDSQAPEKGTKGTAISVDDVGDIMVRWDNGSRLKLIPDLDEYKVLDESKKLREEETKEPIAEEISNTDTTQSSNSTVPIQQTTTQNDTNADTTEANNTTEEPIDAEYSEVVEPDVVETNDSNNTVEDATYTEVKEEEPIEAEYEDVSNSNNSNGSTAPNGQSTNTSENTQTKGNTTKTNAGKNTTPDATAVAMSKLFGTSDIASALSKITKPVSRIYIQDGKVMVENLVSENKIIEDIGIKLPEYLKLSEAKALFKTQLASLNDFLPASVADYLNERGINITSISRDQTGKFTLSDGSESYRLADIENYIKNNKEVTFDTVYPITNEDLMYLKSTISDMFTKMQKHSENTVDIKNIWVFENKKRAKIIYKVGNIIKSPTTIKLGESFIKRFKEDDSDILNNALSSYYTNRYKTTPKDNSQIQIQFYAYLYGDSFVTKPISNTVVSKQDIQDVARNMMSRLNKGNILKKVKLSQNVNKDTSSQGNNKDSSAVAVYHFYMGDAQNILIPKDKNYFVFTLLCTKEVKANNDTKLMKVAKGTGKVLGGITKRAGTAAKGIFNTLATASGAVVNSSKQAAQSTSAPKAL